MADAAAKVSGYVRGLEAMAIATLPDCTVYDSWTNVLEHSLEDVAANVAQAYVLQSAALESLGDVDDEKSESFVLTESGTVITRPINEYFLAICFFSAQVPLGLARLHARQVAGSLADKVPNFGASRETHLRESQVASPERVSSRPPTAVINLAGDSKNELEYAGRTLPPNSDVEVINEEVSVTEPPINVRSSAPADALSSSMSDLAMTAPPTGAPSMAKTARPEPKEKPIFQGAPTEMTRDEDEEEREEVTRIWESDGIPSVPPDSSGMPIANVTNRDTRPQQDVQLTKSAGEILIDQLLEESSDPSLLLLRASMRSGVPLNRLMNPGELSAEETEAVRLHIDVLLGVLPEELR